MDHLEANQPVEVHTKLTTFQGDGDTGDLHGAQEGGPLERPQRGRTRGRGTCSGQ